MRLQCSLMLGLILLALPSVAAEKHKKKGPNRGMLEKMEAVPCGARERGITGVGSVFGSAGIEHVSSDEKLCPQYLLRTDDMEYHIRPTDGKHPVILPVGEEGEFKIKKDKMYMKVPEGDRKTRTYQVVAIKPTNAANSDEDAKGASLDRSVSDRLAADRSESNKKNPPNPQDPPRQ